jgi:hypothetical protein
MQVSRNSSGNHFTYHEIDFCRIANKISQRYGVNYQQNRYTEFTRLSVDLQREWHVDRNAIMKIGGTENEIDEAKHSTNDGRESSSQNHM